MMAATPERTKLRWDSPRRPSPRPRPPARPPTGCSSTAIRRRRAAASAPTINPATESRSPRSRSPAPRTSRAPSPPPRAAQPKWAALPALERGKYLFRIARLIQERARELAIVETIDGGKPIRESRDSDIPLAAAHFFHYAGGPTSWPTGSRVGIAAAGRRRPDRAVELPADDGRVEARAALACGNTAILEPAETTPLTALLLAEICQEAELPPAWSHRHRRRRDRRRARARRGHRQGRLHGLDRGRQGHPGRAGRPRRRLTLELGGKRPTSCSRTPRSTRRSRRSSRASSSTRATCAAPARGCWCRSVAEAVEAKLWERMQRLRLGDPLDKNADVSAVNSGEQLERIETLVAAGEEEGACAAGEPATSRSAALVRARRCSPRSRPCTGSRSRRSSAGRLAAHLPHPGGGDREGQQVSLRPRGLQLDERAAKRSRSASALQAGVVWQNTYNHFDPTAASAASRRPASGARAAPPVAALRGVHEPAAPGAEDLSSTSGGTSCARSSVATTRSHDRGKARGQHRARLAQGRPRRRRPRARRSRAGRRGPRTTAPDPLPRRRGAGVAPGGDRARRPAVTCGPLRGLDDKVPTGSAA